MQTLDLTDAYRKIFNEKPPENYEDWQLAQEIFRDFDVPALGEEFAKWVCWFVICEIQYPTQEIRHTIVIHAECHSAELFEEFDCMAYAEPHMDQIEWIGRQRQYFPDGFSLS
jgi:hypothetical protein